MRTDYQPPADMRAQIYAFLEVNPDFFEKTKAEVAMYKITPPLKPLHTGVDEHTGQVANDHQHHAVDTVYVERYKGVNGAAGPGQLTPHDYVIERVEFNPSVARLGVPVKYLRLIHVKGDSMEPTFYDGDEVFVDVRCDRFDDNAIYVIQQDDLTRIKRVQLRLDGSVAIKSDNDGGFPPEIYSAGEAGSFSIIGKVIPWKFGRFKL